MSAAGALDALVNDFYTKHNEIQKLLKYIEKYEVKARGEVKALINGKKERMNLIIVEIIDNYKKLNNDKKIAVLKWVPFKDMKEYIEKYNNIKDIQKYDPLQSARTSARTSARLQPLPPRLPALNLENFNGRTSTTGALPSQEQAVQQLIEERTPPQIQGEKKEKRLSIVPRHSKNRVAQEPELASSQQPLKKGLGFSEWFRFNLKGNPIPASQSKGTKDQEKIAIINYFNLRYRYLHQFIREIKSILYDYNFDTFNNIALEEIKKILEELEQTNNFILDDNLSEIQIFEKIELHNKIIKRFLTSILHILTKGTKNSFLKWIKSNDYKDLRILSYKSILEADNVSDENMKVQLEVVQEDFSNIEFYLSNKSLLSANPIDEYKTDKDDYITSHIIVSPLNLKGGGFGLKRLKEFYSLYKNVGRVPVEAKKTVVNSDVMGNIDYNSLERHNIDAIKNYILEDIIQFFNIINTVLKYIDIIALYIKLDERIPTKPDDDITVSLKLSNIISESDTYLTNLKKKLLSSSMSSMTSNLKIHQSIYLYYNEVVYNDEEVPYTTKGTGGRKRAIGRPLKTPAKPTKPTKKPTTKPAKHAKKPATKPAKPTKKPTPKPTKPVAKKPTKPTKK